MSWRNRAACLEEDPERFFPIGNTGPALLQIEEATAVCRRCEVVETCLKWAIESGQDAGVWGGLSEDERRALKRRNARARRAGRHRSWHPDRHLAGSGPAWTDHLEERQAARNHGAVRRTTSTDQRRQGRDVTTPGSALPALS